MSLRLHVPLHGRDSHYPDGPDPLLTDITLNALIDGQGSAITTGVKGDVVIHADFWIAAWTLVADVSGDIELDIWRAAYADFPPDVGDSIVAADPPTLSGQSNARDTTLTGWTNTLDEGDVLRFNVNSASAVSRVTLALTLRPRKG